MAEYGSYEPEGDALSSLQWIQHHMNSNPVSAVDVPVAASQLPLHDGDAGAEPEINFQMLQAPIDGEDNNLAELLDIAQQISGDHQEVTNALEQDNTNEIQQFLIDQRNVNTDKKTRCETNSFRKFLQTQRREYREIYVIPPQELDLHLQQYFFKATKQNGELYEPDTITSHQKSIDRYLRENSYKWSIIRNIEFAKSREVLSAKRKSLKKEGKGNRPNRAEALTPNDEERLWEHGQLGSSNAKSLLNSVWYFNTKCFGLRGRDEHHKMTWGDVQLKRNSDGKEYLEYSERNTKTRSGQVNSERPFKPMCFATPQNAETCPVNMYKAYQSHRPADMMETASPFYLAIDYGKRPTDTLWFKRSKVGQNTLGLMMKKMAENAGITGKKTNHSGRKTAVQSLLSAGVPPTQIAQLTAHKNVNSINHYAVASEKQRENMSDILTSNARHTNHPYGTIQPTGNTACVVPSATVQVNPPGSGCTFNINVNIQMATATTAICSPPPKRRRPYVLYDDDSQ